MTKWYDTALSNFIEALQDTLDAKLDAADAFSGDYNDLTNKPNLSSVSHTHTSSDITDLEDEVGNDLDLLLLNLTEEISKL